MTVARLVVEIGVEELPVSFMRTALDAMPQLWTDAMGDLQVQYGTVEAVGTPRRLTWVVDSVAHVQPSRTETITGPPKAVAFDSNGEPTKAGQGFARKQGVDPQELFVLDTEKGSYAALRRTEPARNTLEVLPATLALLCTRIPFPKRMRWGHGDTAFGRPVQWLCALLGDSPVPFEFAGITAQGHSRGHRFLAPHPFPVVHADNYEALLQEHHVLVREADRISHMTEQLNARAKALGGVWVQDEFLIRECASLVEKPHVLPGRFESDFLRLPERATMAVMRDHQRYFAVRHATDEALLPAYLNVVNTAAAPEVIQEGNDRVLRARLQDAQFFYQEDQKRTLEDRCRDLERVTFQNKLGTLADKVERIVPLSAWLHPGEHTERAATLCKADLTTLMVQEFPELEGTMGADLARHQGQPREVATAIEEHHLPRGAHDRLPSTTEGAAVAVADRADTLVGCFAVGITPTGSADPFALRRAALGILRIALDGKVAIRLRDLMERSWDTHGPNPNLKPREEVLDAVHGFLLGRLRGWFAEHHRSDLVSACIAAWDGQDPADLRERIQALEGFRQDPAFVHLAAMAKRIRNITKNPPPGSDVDAGLLEAGAERELWDRVCACSEKVLADVTEHRYLHALQAMSVQLHEPLTRFFDDVMVMAEDERVRSNRVRLLLCIASMVESVAHLDLLDVESHKHPGG